MKKSEFKEFVAQCMSRTGKTMRIGCVSLNNGEIYNPRYNHGQAIQYMRTCLEKTTDYMWRKAKAAGEFEINGETIKL